MTYRVLITMLVFMILAGPAFLPAQDIDELRNRFIRNRDSGNNQNDSGGAKNEQPAQNNNQPAGNNAANQNQAGQPNQAARQPSRPAPGEQQAQPAGPALGEFNVQTLSENMRLLRIHPAGKTDRQDLQVNLGEEFTTEITMNNTDNSPFDELRILLSYETDFITPVAINDSPIAENLADEPTAELDPLFGNILYEAKLREPMVLNDTPILSIRWKTERVKLQSPIVFSKRDEIFTTINGDGEDLLGSPRMPGDGTLNMNVTILPEDPREAEALLTDPRTFDPSTEKIGGVRVFLKPPDEKIIVGQAFAIDVILDNRAFSKLDNLQVVLTYDSEVLDIVDADYNNLITLGTNIHDGPFRDNYPWNFHIDNTVFHGAGEIVYRVGTDDPEITRGKVGTIARIYAVATRPVAATPIRFRFSENPRARATRVTFMGADALGDPEVLNDSVQGLILRVHPESRYAQSQ